MNTPEIQRQALVNLLKPDLKPDPKLQAKLDKARREITNDKRYAPIMSLLWSRDDKFDDTIATAATDGTIHYWSPVFVDQHPVSYIKFVKLHELAHDWLYHSSGRAKELRDCGKYTPEIVAHAIDHAVNNFLADCGETVPPDAVFDRQYQGWSAEEICHELLKNPPPPQDGSGGKGDGTPTDDHSKMNNATPQQVADAKQATDKAMADASIMEGLEKAAGLDPEDSMGSDNMGSMLESARNAKHKAKSWKDELDEIKGDLKSDERIGTYSRVCRRPIEGLIRPGKKREGSPKVGIILDTSGSMYCDLPKAMAEFEVMSDDGFTFDVICTDGDVYGPYSFEQGEFDYRSLPLEGGGGSDMVPAFEKFKDHCPDCDALVFCTDGCISWPTQELINSLEIPVILCEFRPRKSSEGSRFHKHLLIKD